MSGPAYGRGPFSELWREYANADRRCGGTDFTVVGLDILTVFVAGPLALWRAEMGQTWRMESPREEWR